jgi:hypothetical protein
VGCGGLVASGGSVAPPGSVGVGAAPEGDVGVGEMNPGGKLVGVGEMRGVMDG